MFEGSQKGGVWVANKWEWQNESWKRKNQQSLPGTPTLVEQKQQNESITWKISRKPPSKIQIIRILAQPTTIWKLIT